jgi:hypothetical protein
MGSIDYRPLGWSPLVLAVQSWSALFLLKPPGNCWGIKVGFTQLIGSERALQLSFDYKFGGET